MTKQNDLTFEPPDAGPRNGSQARRHVYRVRFDDQEMADLQDLARERRVPASVVLRELIREARSRGTRSPSE
jgi:hypothetical protein